MGDGVSKGVYFKVFMCSAQLSLDKLFDSSTHFIRKIKKKTKFRLGLRLNCQLLCSDAAPMCNFFCYIGDNASIMSVH